MRRQELEIVLREFVLSTYTAEMNGVRELAIDDSFTELQLFDSLTLMSFISYVERLCSISIPADHIRPENFDTLGRVLAYIEQRGA